MALCKISINEIGYIYYGNIDSLKYKMSLLNNSQMQVDYLLSSAMLKYSGLFSQPKNDINVGCSRVTVKTQECKNLYSSNKENFSFNTSKSS